MANHTSKATKTAIEGLRGRSPATSETDGNRVGYSSTDNHDGDHDEDVEESGPSLGSSIPIIEIGNPDIDKEAETGEGSTNGIYQTARGDSATEETGPTTNPNGETASARQTCSRSDATEAEYDTYTSRRRRAKPKGKSDIMAGIGQTVKSMYGRLELQLLEMEDHAIEEEDIVGWADAHCHRLERAFYIHKGKFAAISLSISTVEGIGEAMRNVQWLWDKRKTKDGREAR